MCTVVKKKVEMREKVDEDREVARYQRSLARKANDTADGAVQRGKEEDEEEDEEEEEEEKRGEEGERGGDLGEGRVS